MSEKTQCCDDRLSPPVVSAALWFLACVKCTFLCTQGSRVRPASGTPCALYFERVTIEASLGQIMSRECGLASGIVGWAKRTMDSMVQRTRCKRAHHPACKCERWWARRERAFAHPTTTQTTPLLHRTFA